MSYKLLAADLDGTLMGDDAVISPRVKAAVKRAIEGGGHPGHGAGLSGH